MAYAAALMEAAGVTQDQSARLLAELGLRAGPRVPLDEREFATLYRSLVMALDDEMLGFFSRPLRPGALKYTCLALLDAKNLMVSLHRWSWMYRVVQDDLLLELTTTGDTARIAIEHAPQARHCRPFATDLLLKLIHGVSSWLTGRCLPLVRVDFDFERPAYADDYALLYPGPVHFGQARPALVFDAALLQLPIRRTRAQLDDFLQRAPEDWLFTHARPRARSAVRLSLRLRDHLAERLPQAVTAETAADALAVSVRTLHRRLADEGTSFQRVKDELRRDRAMQLLARSPLPISGVSEQLGFDSVASFHRAFRGWTGLTPGAFRGDGVATAR